MTRVGPASPLFLDAIISRELELPYLEVMVTELLPSTLERDPQRPE